MGVYQSQRLVRVICGVALFVCALFTPLYVLTALFILFLIFYRHPLEVFFAALVRDLLFGTPVLSYGDSGYVTTGLAIILILFAYALCSFLRGRNFRILGA